MSDEAKKDGQGPEEVKSEELSAEDLEQVTGGASVESAQQAVTANKSKTASKSTASLQGFISS